DFQHVVTQIRHLQEPRQQVGFEHLRPLGTREELEVGVVHGPDIRRLLWAVECAAMAVQPDTIQSTDIRAEDLEQHRRELTGYCYRMLGSSFEADDAVQETMVRAWRGIDGFEGRSAVKSWLYRIATNVCLDMLRGSQRRARPMDLGPARKAELSLLGPMLPEHEWVSPIADTRIIPDDGDPAEVAASRESIRLAFVAALQHLPARQRAVLIL